MALALLLVSIFGLAVATLLLLELLSAVPTAIGFVVLVSIVAAFVMLWRAVREKVASLPQLQRGPTPTIRQLRR
jgi:membrane protein implicated in regulation of membrane protease activity